MTNLHLIIIGILLYLLLSFYIGKKDIRSETYGDVIIFISMTLIPLLGQIFLIAISYETIKEQYKNWNHSKYKIFREIKTFWNKPLNK
jgi:heme/copper-type cytochrome/quinol oxidase subunit 2